MANLFGELRRRNVVRVGIAYIVLGWVTLQVGDLLFDLFEAPAWVGKSLAVLLMLGFPFACLFAWAFELTPEGVKKTAEVDRSRSITHSTGRKLDLVIIAALVVALGYFVWERQGGNTPAARSSTVVERSIAVLPFVNMSSDAEQEWFADGLTEEILNALARTPDLLVASRTSSFQFKGQNADVSAIAESLGVAHILEGSVRRGGDRLRVTAQLIRASDGFHLWSETFDRKPEDVIQIQEDVAFEIAKALETAMDPEALRRMVSAGTSSIPAYEAYLEGLALSGGAGAAGSAEGWNAARLAFERATEIDTDFSEAYFWQARFWASQMSATNIMADAVDLPRDEAVRRFGVAIDAAIRSSRNPARSSYFEATRALTELRYAEATEQAQRYMTEYPNDTSGLSLLISVHGKTRAADSARPLLARLVEVSSEDPVELNTLINNLLFLGLVDEAVAVARDGVSRHSDHTLLLYQSHRALLWDGNTAEAARLVATLTRSKIPEANLGLVRMRQACAEGNVDEANRLAQGVLSRGDVSERFIALQILGRPAEAHQVLVDEKLDRYALSSFLQYPYFDHNYFPELDELLERQGINRPHIDGPPYRCEST